MHLKYPIDKILDTINSSSHIIEDLEDLDTVVKELDKERDKGLTQERQTIIQGYLKTQNVYNSNAIEGNSLDLRETEMIINSAKDYITKTRNKQDYIEAKSLSEAIDYFYNQIIKNKLAFEKRLVLELHSIVMKNIINDSGQYRNTNVNIKGASHTPPDFLHVNDYMNEMYNWFDQNKNEYSSIIVSSIIKHWITWIHPFSDGNGRLSRLVYQLILVQSGYPLPIIKLNKRQEYYDALSKSDSGNLLSLIDLTIQAVSQTVEEWDKHIKEWSLKDNWLKKFAENKGDEEVNYQKQQKQLFYRYEVFKGQINRFALTLEAVVNDLNEYLSNQKNNNISLHFIRNNEITFEQYQSLLEESKYPLNNRFNFLKIIKDSYYKRDSLTVSFWYGFITQKDTVNLRIGGSNEVKVNLGSGSRPNIIVLNPSIRLNGQNVPEPKLPQLRSISVNQEGDTLSYKLVNDSLKEINYKKTAWEVSADFVEELISILD